MGRDDVESRVSVLEKMAEDGERSHRETRDTLQAIEKEVGKISMTQDVIAEKLGDGKSLMADHSKRIADLEASRTAAQASLNTAAPIAGKLWQAASMIAAAILGGLGFHFTLGPKP